MGATPPVCARVAANRRSESPTIEPATRSGCWCSTAVVKAEISALRLAAGGRAVAYSGDAPECWSQSGPWACSRCVGHNGRAAAGSFSVPQSAAAAIRPAVPCPWASQNCPVRA